MSLIKPSSPFIVSLPPPSFSSISRALAIASSCILWKVDGLFSPWSLFAQEPSRSLYTISCWLIYSFFASSMKSSRLNRRDKLGGDSLLS